MPTISQLVVKSRQWASQCLEKDPSYFQNLAKGQSPQYFFVGCADSRVSPLQICGLTPGEVFVHRNVANIVSGHDTSLLASLTYAVDVLQVKHVIVKGHYCCGGVEAALRALDVADVVDNWIQPIKSICQKYQSLLADVKQQSAAGQSEQRQWDLACELNAIEQAAMISVMPPVRKAWKRGQPLTVTAMVYNLAQGQLIPLSQEIAQPLDLAEFIDQSVANVQKRWGLPR